MGLPPCDPVSKKNLPEFALLREKWLPVLKKLELLELTSAATASAAAATGTP